MHETDTQKKLQCGQFLKNLIYVRKALQMELEKIRCAIYPCLMATFVSNANKMRKMIRF